MKLTLTFEIETMHPDLELLGSMIDSIESLLQGNIYIRNAEHIDTIIHCSKNRP